MKIAFLRTAFDFDLKTGGSVSHIAGFVSGINQLNQKLFFISSDKLAEINSAKNPIYLIRPFKILTKISYFGVLLYNFQFIPKASKILKTQKPDVIYQRNTCFNVSGGILRKN